MKPTRQGDARAVEHRDEHVAASVVGAQEVDRTVGDLAPLGGVGLAETGRLESRRQVTLGGAEGHRGVKAVASIALA